MDTILQAPMSGAHMVTITPITHNPGIFRVQDTGVGKIYVVYSNWIKEFFPRGAWHEK